MNCSCIRNNFNFHIKVLSCGELLYEDLNNWMTEDYYVIQEDYEVSIKFPSDTEIKVVVDTEQSTKLNASELIHTACFPDGIYCFSVESCGKKYTRNKAIVCNTECRLANLIREASKENNKEKWEEVIKLKASLDAVYAHSELGNFELANEEYKYLKKKLDNLNCKC